MFEDLIAKQKTFQWYICPNADKCNSDFCLHKGPHGKDELGRPYQPEGEDPCDCSIHECKYFVNNNNISHNGKICCVPIEDKI